MTKNQLKSIIKEVIDDLNYAKMHDFNFSNNIIDKIGNFIWGYSGHTSINSIIKSNLKKLGLNNSQINFIRNLYISSTRKAILYRISKAENISDVKVLNKKLSDNFIEEPDYGFGIFQLSPTSKYHKLENFESDIEKYKKSYFLKKVKEETDKIKSLK